MFFRGKLFQAFKGPEPDARVVVINHSVDQRFFDIFISGFLGKNLNCPKSGSRIVRVSQCTEQQPANGIILQASLEPHRLGNFACKLDLASNGIRINDLNIGD